MKYGITGNTARESVKAPTCEIIAWLASRGLVGKLDQDLAATLTDCDLSTIDICSFSEMISEVDVVLSVGGDGTFLNTVHQLEGSETLVAGVNAGRLGFLANIEKSEIDKALSALEAGQFTRDVRSILETSIDGRPDPLHALNDLVIDRGPTQGLLALRVSVDGTFLNRYYADGVIFSTSTGSTAYSLSLGGPIIMPGSGVMLVTPIAAHTLSVRPVVISEWSEVEVEIEPRTEPYQISADGRRMQLDPSESLVRITRSDRFANLVKLNDQDYFSTLRRKLKWGSSGLSDLARPSDEA